MVVAVRSWLPAHRVRVTSTAARDGEQQAGAQSGGKSNTSRSVRARVCAACDVARYTPAPPRAHRPSGTRTALSRASIVSSQRRASGRRRVPGLMIEDEADEEDHQRRNRAPCGPIEAAAIISVADMFRVSDTIIVSNTAWQVRFPPE